MGKPSGIIGGFNHLPKRISGKLFILLALGWLIAGPAHATVIVRQLDPTPEGWSIGWKAVMMTKAAARKNAITAPPLIYCARPAPMNGAPLAACLWPRQWG